MKKSELIEQVAERAQTSRAAAARVLEAIFDATSGTIAHAVKAGQQVSIPGFGKFKPKTRPARRGRNPRTGQEIDIPERTVVSFSPGKGLRDTLDGSGGGGRKSGAKSTAAKGTAAKRTAAKGAAAKGAAAKGGARKTTSGSKAAS